jgi:alpha-beta hydrolase superfamily lysophospholipase
MDAEQHLVEEPDGHASVVFRWSPSGAQPRAALHILHGWGEHARRYDRFARNAAGRGLIVTADDHRGHGQTGLHNGTLGDLGERGMDGVLESVRLVIDRARHESSGLPLFVLGHSWGSFLLQRYLRRWGSGLSGALLTGTTYRDPSAPATERRSPNERFEPARTAYDWLSRDEAEVDAYIADPLCGFEVMSSRPGGAGAADEAELSPIPPSLPVIVLNGADDPIGGESGGAALADHYRSLGLTDVTFRAYPGARHELLNETNRDEVEADILTWIDAHLPDAG